MGDLTALAKPSEDCAASRSRGPAAAGPASQVFGIGDVDAGPGRWRGPAPPRAHSGDYRSSWLARLKSLIPTAIYPEGGEINRLRKALWVQTCSLV